MSKGYSIRVRIGGRALSIISDAKPEYMTQIAAKVDNSITNLMNSNSGLTFEKAAVLTALKFCDEAVNAANKQNDNITKKQNKTEENTEKECNSKVEVEADNLRKQVVAYSKELSRLEKENKALMRELAEAREK
ncbi:MAG: cell division protein ZapA [Clostridia bacterium]|nr:cell division protein ZapA [Clostridia bacterium]